MDTWNLGWLNACRQNLGSRTGEFWRENRSHLEIGPAPGFGPDDGLYALWKDQEKLFARGEIQLAVRVKANRNLFHRAWVGAPGFVLHGPDPRSAENIAELQEIASNLFELGQQKPEDPELARFAAVIGDDWSQQSWVPVPRTIGAGRELYVSTMFFCRDHMPDRWLAGRLFPIVCLREETPACALLPSRYWPEELVRAWRAQPEPTQSCADRETIVIEGHAWPTPVLGFGALLATEFVVERFIGDDQAYQRERWPLALGFALAGLALFLFDRWDRRPTEVRYFAPACAHPIEVRVDRRFFRLSPRVWSYVAFAIAVVALGSMAVH